MRLASVVDFLAAVLVLAQLCADERCFARRDRVEPLARRCRNAVCTATPGVLRRGTDVRVEGVVP
jgi:hypothetical protein